MRPSRRPIHFVSRAACARCGPLAALVLASCGRDEAGARPAPASPSAVPTAVTAAPAAAPTPAECLRGTYRLTAEHATAFYRAVLASSGAPTEVQRVAGESVMSFNDAGNASLQMAGLTVTYTVTAGAPLEMTLTLSGMGASRYELSGDVVSFSGSTTRFEGQLTMRAGGRDTPLPWNASIGDAFERRLTGRSRVRCTEGRLELTSLDGPGVATVWVR